MESAQLLSSRTSIICTKCFPIRENLHNPFTVYLRRVWGVGCVTVYCVYPCVTGSLEYCYDFGESTEKNDSMTKPCPVHRRRAGCKAGFCLGPVRVKSPYLDQFVSRILSKNPDMKTKCDNTWKDKEEWAQDIESSN